MTDPLPKKFMIQRKKKAMPTTWTTSGCCGGNFPQWGWTNSRTSSGMPSRWVAPSGQIRLYLASMQMPCSGFQAAIFATASGLPTCIKLVLLWSSSSKGKGRQAAREVRRCELLIPFPWLPLTLLWLPLARTIAADANPTLIRVTKRGFS